MTATRPAIALRRALVSLSLVTVVACGAAPGPAETGQHTDPGGRVLRFAMAKDLSSDNVQRKLIKRWDADHEGVKVEIVELPEDTDRTRSQLVAALQSGNPDGYDIVNLDVIWTAEFAQQRLIAPLEGGLDEEFWPAARRGVSYRDHIWAVPWFIDAGVLYYRADLLGAELKLKRWRDLRQVAAERGVDQGDIEAMVVTQLSSYEGLTVNLHEAVWRHGGEIIDARGRVGARDTATGAALEELAQGLAGPMPLFDEESRNVAERGSIERFLDGKVLAMRNWPFALSWLADDIRRRDTETRDTETRDKEAVDRYGVTTLPGPSALGGWNLAVVARSGQAREARQLIDHLTSPGAARCLYEGGYVPGRRGVLDGERCQAERYLQGGPPDRGQDSAELRRLRAQHLKVLERSLETARPRPVTPYYAAVTRALQDVISDYLRDALRGDDTMEPTVSELTRRLDAALKGR